MQPVEICFTNFYGGKETITGIKIDVLHPQLFSHLPGAPDSLFDGG